MKIIGVASDMEDKEDMEDIAKVAVIGERMRNLQNPKKNQQIIEEKCQRPATKLFLSQNLIHGCLPLLTVKGLS
ncbi:MAG: hypothetical protein JSW60_06300 [Thermoplasmatales archaeon]|nr:MAG: hypothetical protein JSW60_06300 [Thermoplasmatales archaeon]